jgi:hypothetical protein
MTLLTLINSVQRVEALEVSSNIITNTNPTVQQLRGLADMEGRELALRYTWSVLQKIETHSALAAEDQGTLVSIAADISLTHIRHMTMWNQTTTRRVEGPLSPREWSDLKGSGIAYAWDHFRIYNGKLYITPAPTLADSIAFEYISKNWCQSSGGTAQAAWAADTDTGILDEDIMALGVRWRWRRSIGLDYSEEFNDYERRVMQVTSGDGAKPTLTMDSGMPYRGVLVANSVTRSF